MKSLTIVLLMLSLQAVIGFVLKDLEEPIKKCSVPKKLEGKFKLSLKMGSPSHQVQIATGTGTLHADETIGKAAVVEKVKANGKMTDVKVYIGNNITYIAMPAMKICQQKAMDIPIIPGKVPPGVTLNIKRGELEGVHVQIWEFNLKPEMNAGVGGSAVMYLTEDKCMPVKVEMKMETNGQTMYVLEELYDMEEGVKDDDVFKLPKICEKQSHYGNSHRLPRSVDWHIKHAIARHEMRSHILA